jgi:colanic acid biosynthesis glycosyl transferase WcaI
MRVLLLNQYYPPDTSATAKVAASIARALAKRHQVRVIAGRPSYDATQSYPWRLLRRETHGFEPSPTGPGSSCPAREGDILIERVGSTAYPRFQMRRRVANYLTYSVLAVLRSVTVRADVVLAMTDPPFAGILGAFVSALSRRPLVYNIHDLYPEMALGGEIVRPRAWVRLWERLHRWALRRAARIIVLGDDMRDRIVAKGINPSRVEVVRDGADLTPAAAAGHRVSQEIRSGFRFVALHAGNLGFYGAWDTLLEAARGLGNDGLGIIFIGEGAQKRRLADAANGTQAVRFLPYRPEGELPYVLAAADVHIITVKRGLEGVVVPSKLYPVLAAGKPVLAVAAQSTDVARIITRAGCGLVVDPDAPASVAAAIRSLAAQPEKLADMGRRAQAVAAQFERASQLEKFVTIVERTANEL